jgi:hypothetical protein
MEFPYTKTEAIEAIKGMSDRVSFNPHSSCKCVGARLLQLKDKKASWLYSYGCYFNETISGPRWLVKLVCARPFAKKEALRALGVNSY